MSERPRSADQHHTASLHRAAIERHGSFAAGYSRGALDKAVGEVGLRTNTNLEAHLKRSGVTQVVIAGVATSNGVEATARHAYELGFNVTVAIDAMTDMSPDAHINSITRTFPKLGETGTTQTIIDLLDKRNA